MDKSEDTIKVIFLDIDGVLNGYNFWNQLGWRIVSKTNNSYLMKLYRDTTEPFGIHEPKVRNLARIVRKTGAKIVVSSSWRFGLFDSSSKKTDDELKFWRLCKKYNIPVIGYTPCCSGSHRREDEIISWLSNHEKKRNSSPLAKSIFKPVSKFIILDDDSYDLQCFVGSNLIQTSDVKCGKMIKGNWRENTGLRRKHVRKAIKLLNERER